MNATALAQCLGGQSSGDILQIAWAMSQIRTCHHHVAFQSQGWVCPLYYVHFVPWKKRSQDSAPWLTLAQVCSKTFSDWNFCFLFLHTQVGTEMQAAHGQLPSWATGWKEPLGLLAVLSHPERLLCSFLEMDTWEKTFKMCFKYS